MSRLSIVVPVYYNSDTLRDLYDDLKAKVFDKIPDIEIVFTDDGSGDDSWEVMNEIRRRDPEHVKCVKLSRNFGEHAALLAGLSVCTGDCAVTKQADLQEDSAIIPEMFESWKKGNDVVLAVRNGREDPFLKKAMAGLYYKVINRFVDKNMPVGGCDCYLVDRKVIEVLKILNEKNSSLTLQVLWSGFQTDRIYFHRDERKSGKSRWTLAKKVKLAMDSMMSFSYFPIRFMTALGFVFAIISVIWIIATIVEKMTVGTPIAGWASIMCLNLFTSGVSMLMIGVIGEYVWRTLDASRTRPPFIIDRVESAGTEPEEEKSQKTDI